MPSNRRLANFFLFIIPFVIAQIIYFKRGEVFLHELADIAIAAGFFSLLADVLTSFMFRHEKGDSN